MDEEQAARWATAQREVEVGAELVSAAQRQLLFLAAVDRRRWIYEGPSSTRPYAGTDARDLFLDFIFSPFRFRSRSSRMQDMVVVGIA